MTVVQSNMIKIFFIATLFMVAFTGCSSTPKEVVKIPTCVFPGTDVAAPGWVCDEPISDIPVSAVGISEPSNAGISFMKDIATADARGKLASQFQVQVQKMVKSYFGTTGIAQTETVDRVAESVLKTITNQTLIGSKVYRSVIGPKGRYFVLVGLDNENIQKAAEAAIRTSMNNERAVWQKMQAKRSFDELAEEISKQQVQ